MLLLFPGSNLRAARGEERHIDDEKNAFVCVCVCVCVFTLLRLFARTNLCCFSSFFDFSIYIIKCLLLVRQSRRFEQTKRKNTLTTRGSANICLRAPYHGAFKFHSYKTRFSFGNENRRARARARESLKKKSKELVSRRTHYRESGNKGIRSQLCHFMRVMHKARSTPLSTHFLLFESALFAFLLTFSRAHARCFPRFVFLRASHPAYE